MGQPGAGGDKERRAGRLRGGDRSVGRRPTHGPRSGGHPAALGSALLSLVGVAFGDPTPPALQGEGGLIAAGGGRRLRLARFLVVVAPWLLLAGGTLFTLLLPPRYGSVVFFVGAPLIAAPFYALRSVVVIGGLSLVGVVARNFARETLNNANGVSQLGTCLMVGVLAVLINVIVHRGYVMLASARQVATAAQIAVLPQPPERLAGLDVAAHYVAAQAGTLIGGDFYAAQDTPYGVRFVVGDVRGKGMGAVGAVAVIIGAYREAAEHVSSLQAVAQRLDRALAREAARRPQLNGFEEFATAVLVELPRGGDTLRIVNRGHPTPLLLHPDGHLDEPVTPEPGLPLGMADLGSWPDGAQEIPFPSGTMLLLHTDGLTEARDKRGDFYDPVARLKGRVFDSPSTLLTTLVDEVRRHTGDGATDDLALLAVRRP